VRTPTLIINRQPHRWLYRGERCLLPLAFIEPHLVTHTDGGVDGLDPRAFPDTHVCRLSDDDQWRSVCEWIIHTRRVDRIIAPNERFLLLAAELREKFGIDGLHLSTAQLFRDKVEMKRAVQTAGVRVPDFIPLDAPEQFDSLDWTSGPKILKRRNFIGAMDVHVVETPDIGRQLWHRLDATAGQYEVEEYINGPMYHCDSVVQDGEITFSSVSQYLSRPGDFHSGGMGGSKLLLHGDLRDRILDLNTRAITGLGLRNGATHLEVFHTPDDEVVFCEVAARPGGGGIDRINDRGFGVDFIECAIQLDAGMPVDVLEAGRPGDSQVWGCVGFYPGCPSAEGIDPSRFAALGIAEHEHDPSVARRAAPRHCTDYVDLYVVSAPDDAAFESRVTMIQAEYEARGEVKKRPDRDAEAGR
jgi:hypothetical protein